MRVATCCLSGKHNRMQFRSLFHFVVILIVLMSPATDMNFQCFCWSCRYELNYQIFDSQANHLENLEGSKRRRSHWKVGLSCKLRKYKNLKLNCSKGKLRKYRIGNFLMQEQQESRLATRRKKAQTKHKKTLYSRNSKKGERKRNRGKGNVSVFMLFCCLRKIFTKTSSSSKISL